MADIKTVTITQSCTPEDRDANRAAAKEDSPIDHAEYLKSHRASTGQVFYNAIGTSDDGHSKIEVWRELSGQDVPECVNLYCESETKQKRGDLVGAHVVLKMPTGNITDGEKFWLIPICRGCNGRDDKIKLDIDPKQELIAPCFEWKKRK